MAFLSNLSLKIKLILFSIFFVICLLTVGGIAIQRISILTDDYDQVAKISLPKINDVFIMLSLYRQVRIDLRTLGIPNLSESQIQQATNNVRKSIEEYDNIVKDFLKYPMINGQK